MSIPVELADLRSKTAEYTWAYLLTVRPDATPHLVSLSPQWSDPADSGSGSGPVILLSVSSGTARNAAAGATVTLCYPPLDHDGYSLIVDGTAAARAGAGHSGIDVPDGKQLICFSPTGAVLHRSAAPGFANSATGCANDCLPVTPDA
ncbi:pyridoxamine 5'-phosphate oxidase family protein [Ilumatobacter sp.]|uniref:pyridoxamine 5'-phosphate oxidase family protein n=1 Tax=Ilumatobacter sp. TaxID=1967498 RepID=UPI0037538CA1